MICVKCKSRESKTPNFSYCNNCYYKKYNKKNRDKITGYKYGGNRMRAIVRDNWTCQNCGKNKNEAKLHIHHIDGKGSNLPKEKQNNKVNNLVTLCFQCHRKIDGWKKESELKGRWSRRFEKCIICSTVKYKYKVRGLCTKCFEETRKEYKRVWYQKRYPQLTANLA